MPFLFACIGPKFSFHFLIRKASKTGIINLKIIIVPTSTEYRLEGIMLLSYKNLMITMLVLNFTLKPIPIIMDFFGPRTFLPTK